MSRSVVKTIVVGTLAGVAAACGGSSNGTSGPRNPPVTGLAIAVSSTAVTQNSQVNFTITLPATGVPVGATLYLQISFNGSSGAIDSTTIPSGATGFTGMLNIPSALPDGTLRLTTTLPQQYDTAYVDITVKDSLPPALQSAFIPASTPNIIWVPLEEDGAILTTTNSNDSLAITAFDNHEVAWLGYTIGAPANIRDSISTHDSSATWRLPVSLSAALAGTAAHMTVFAVNADGYRTEWPVGWLDIGTYLTRPVSSVAVDSNAWALIYDAKRNLVYVSQPDQSSIGVLSLATMTFQGSIPLPAAPDGLDITPSGDTLVVALLHTADLAFVNLTSNTLIGTRHLNSLNTTPGDTTQLNWSVSNVRVAGDGTILVSIDYVPELEYQFGLAQIDRLTGKDSILSTGAIWPVAPGRSVDRSKVLLTNAIMQGSTVPNSYAAIYDAVAHTYDLIAPFSNEQEMETPAFADQTGSTYLVTEELYDGSLHALGWVGPYVFSYPTYFSTTLSASGSDVYVSTQADYLRFHVPQPTADQYGQLMEVVQTPGPIRGMWTTPDGHWLLALGLKTIMRFDLTQSTPASTPRIAARRRQMVARRQTEAVASTARTQPSVTALKVLKKK